MMRKVILDGELARRFQPEIMMEADTFADVFRCLECNDPTFKRYLLECDEKEIGFFCKVGDNEITTEEELLLNFNKGDMYISPQPMGARKSAVGKIVAAVIIAYITYQLGPEAGTALTKMQALGQTFGYTLAANLAIQGIQQLLAPDPSVDEQDESYLFQGSGQTIIEGDPVPVLYGELRVPGRPVSFQQVSFNSGAGLFDGEGSDGGGFTANDHCLVGSSKVLTTEGYIPIENLLTGSFVVSATGELNKVLSTRTFEVPEVTSVNNGFLKMTSSHPVMTDKGWAAVDPVMAQEIQVEDMNFVPLSVGSKLKTADDSFIEVTSLETEQTPTQVYTINVSGDSTYIVENIVTHNK